MIRRMVQEDIPAAMRLKQAAGWNQTAQDWANILALEPEGCWVYEMGGQVAASTTVICYGQDLAWVGMVLVLPEFRGRGIARELMAHAMRFTEQRGVRVVRLDATDMGRPLYSKLGFRDECGIERWAVPEAAVAPPAAPICTVPWQNAPELAALDRQAFGADRARVLGCLAECFPAESLRAQEGFALARPGENAHFLGPCVASDAAAAQGLIETLLSGHAGKAVFWDLLPENAVAVRLAQRLGFSCKRRLARMVFGDPKHAGATQGDAALTFAAAGFEFG
jgi:GNAT superfamily N-acetyltransferase